MPIVVEELVPKLSVKKSSFSPKQNEVRDRSLFMAGVGAEEKMVA